MNQRTICKTLAVAVILLFIGIGIQPAIATIEPETPVNDDCDICPKKVSKQHIDRLTTLLDRFEKYDSQLSILSKQYPKFEEKFQELFDIVTTFRELNKELEQTINSDKNIDCDKIGKISQLFMTPCILYILFYEGTGGFLIIKMLLLPIVVLSTAIASIFIGIWLRECYGGLI